MKNYKDETLNMLRKISCHMLGKQYKNNNNYANMLYLEDGLCEYTVEKLEGYGYSFLEYDSNKSNFSIVLSLLEELLKSKGVSKEDLNNFFFQYLNSITLVVSTIQDRKEANLAIVDGDNIDIIKKDDIITNIVIGKDVEPSERILLLMSNLKEEYIKEISK